jgi:hypothetical protein
MNLVKCFYASLFFLSITSTLIIHADYYQVVETKAEMINDKGDGIYEEDGNIFFIGKGKNEKHLYLIEQVTNKNDAVELEFFTNSGVIAGTFEKHEQEHPFVYYPHGICIDLWEEAENKGYKPSKFLPLIGNEQGIVAIFLKHKSGMDKSEMLFLIYHPSSGLQEIPLPPSLKNPYPERINDNDHILIESRDQNDKEHYSVYDFKRHSIVLKCPMDKFNKRLKKNNNRFSHIDHVQVLKMNNKGTFMGIVHYFDKENKPHNAPFVCSIDKGLQILPPMRNFEIDINDKNEVAFSSQTSHAYEIYKWNPKTSLDALKLISLEKEHGFELIDHVYINEKDDIQILGRNASNNEFFWDLNLANIVLWTHKTGFQSLSHFLDPVDKKRKYEFDSRLQWKPNGIIFIRDPYYHNSMLLMPKN